MHKRTAICTVLLMGLVSSTAPEARSSIKFVPWRADHHMHLRSRALYEAWDALCRTLKEQDCIRPDPDKAVVSADAAIASLDEVGARKGVVLSGAYQFGSPFVADQHYDVGAKSRAENEFVASEVARFPTRLIGFFSVAPLDPTAASEVNYWAADRRLKGLKLHLANSRIDFRDSAQVRKVADIVRLAAQHRLPMVIHVKGMGFTPQDAETFIRDVMPAAGDQWVQIAHAGGWGGYDTVTAEVLKTWATHFASRDPAVRHVLFDLAYVVRPSMTPEEASGLVTEIRAIGLDRFVLGSDFDSETPRATDELARTKLPLTSAEWRRVANNCAPWSFSAASSRGFYPLAFDQLFAVTLSKSAID
jgi:predicted TIM-barrel fold metal-dependent hydrolase